MANTFDPRTYKSGLYTTRRLNQQGLGIYGSTRAADFLDDVASGKDSLDILVIGDSNTAYSVSGVAGWVYGWEQALIDLGYTPYGGAVVPCANAAAANSPEGKTSTLGTDMYQNRSSGQSGGSSFVTLGSASGFTEITNKMNSGGGLFRPQSVGVDWAYTAAGSNQQDGLFIQVKAASILGVSSAFEYRNLYATFATGSGSFKLVASQNSGVILAGNRINTNTGVVGTAVATLSLPADPARTGYVNFNRAGGNFAGTDHGIYGPCGFLLESVYKKIKGWSVTSLGYNGGATTSQIANGVINSGDTITTYLSEIRSRQIAAGGTGRVMVFWHSGANDGTGISQWDSDASAGMQAIRNKWLQLNYPEHDLCFVAMVSHPKAQPDDMSVGRNLSKTVTSNAPTNDVTTVIFPEMLLEFGSMTASGYYPGTGPAHLTNTGYSEIISSYLIPNLLAS